MANKNFTDFTLKTPTSGDFLVGYNADGSAEYKTTVNALVSSYATNTALNAASSVLLPTSVYRSTSATFATNTALNAASGILLPTSVYSSTSGSFVTRSFTDSKYLPLSTTNISYINLTTTNALITNLTATNLTNTQTINLSTLNSDISNFLVTSQGSLSARTLANRFSDEINVKDYGAVGDGIADDWLAIQRAIYDSTLAPEQRNALSISATATTTIGNRTILALYKFGHGRTSVIFPAGSYRITKPLVIGHGIVLKSYNPAASNVFILNDSYSVGVQFPCLTDCGFLAASDESATEPYSLYWANYHAHCWITGINFIGGYFLTSGPNGYPVNQSGLVLPEYAWMKWPLGAEAYALANGTAGSTTLTTNYQYNYKQGGKIKLYPSGQIIDINYAEGSNIYLKTPLLTNVVNENYAYGFEKHCGVIMAGGEGSKIQNCWANYFLGSGFFIFGGSPAPIIENTMANFTDIGYRIFDAPCVLIKPSGDCNNQILKCEGFTNTTLIEGKFEDPRPAIGQYQTYIHWTPYPNVSSCRPMIEVEGLPSGTPTFLNINGLTQNGSDLSKVNEPFVKVWTSGMSPVVKLDGIRTLGACYRGFLEHYAYDGTLLETEGRDDAFQNEDEKHHYLGAGKYYNTTRPDGYYDSHCLLGTRKETYHAVAAAGYQMDIQNKKTLRRSGRMPNLIRFTRSGNTATLTYRNSADSANAQHGLVVGDHVYFRNYTFTSGSGELTYNGNSRDGKSATSSTIFYIKSVPTPETFTIAVADSGAVAGYCNVYSQQYVAFHIVKWDEHLMQMPSNTGSIYTYDWTDPNNPVSEYRAWTIYNRKRDVVATLSVPQENKGTWWVKDQFAAGGTSSVSPAFRILHGSGAPLTSAPNGSMYLRTDGGASSTIYARVNNTWVAMSSAA